MSLWDTQVAVRLDSAAAPAETGVGSGWGVAGTAAPEPGPPPLPERVECDARRRPPAPPLHRCCELAWLHRTETFCARTGCSP